MTRHEFMRMLFTAQQTARESVECALAVSRQIDRLVEAFYTDNFAPLQWTINTKEADDAETDN